MYWSKFKFFLIQMDSNLQEVLAGGWGKSREKKNFDQFEKKRLITENKFHSIYTVHNFVAADPKALPPAMQVCMLVSSGSCLNAHVPNSNIS